MKAKNRRVSSYIFTCNPGLDSDNVANFSLSLKEAKSNSFTANKNNVVVVCIYFMRN